MERPDGPCPGGKWDPAVTELTRIIELCRLGARPPVIRALIPLAADKVIKPYWEEFQGKKPPKGPVPGKIDFYFRSYDWRLHASFIVAAYRNTLKGNIDRVDAYVAAYRAYQETFADQEKMSFDRAWMLIRAYGCGHLIDLLTCPHCKSNYVHDPNDIIDHRTCPVCRTMTRLARKESETGKRLDTRQGKLEVGAPQPSQRDKNKGSGFLSA